MAEDSHIIDAKLAEQAERYEDMVRFMRDFVAKKGSVSLSGEERNLLSVAYKNVIGAKRSSWRIISTLQSKKIENGENSDVEVGYLKVIVGELEEKCGEVLTLIANYLKDKDVGEDVNGEELVFFRKMEGDYLRYLVEVTNAKEAERKVRADKSMEAYEKATEIAEMHLPPTHPIRLGLALNFSVFHYEILGDPATACTLAKKAFDNSIAELEQLQDDSYKDSTLIMQLLRDNLTLWTSSNSGQDDDDAN